MTETVTINRLDEYEAALAARPAVHFPVVNHFIDGFYIRETHMPAGTEFTGMKHLTRHPFYVKHGRLTVADEMGNVKEFEAGQWGMTEPGTRRAAINYGPEEVVWITFHANEDNTQDVELIGSRILAPHVNPLLGEDHPRLNQWKHATPETPCLGSP